MYEKIEGEYYISFKSLRELHQAGSDTINKIIDKNKIEVFKYSQSYYIAKEDYKIIKKSLSKNRKCKMCDNDFIAKTRNEKYCSPHCRDKNNQLNYLRGTTDKSRGSNIVEGIRMSKKMMNCSTECLLEEFGDIE